VGKTRIGTIILLVVAVAVPAKGQTPLEKLRGDVKKLTENECSPSTPAAVRDVNGKILSRRRESLALLLQEQIAELKEYPKKAGISLTAEDEKDLEAALAPLQTELAEAQKPENEVCGATAGEASEGNASGEKNPKADASNSAKQNAPAVKTTGANAPAGKSQPGAVKSEPQEPAAAAQTSDQGTPKAAAGQGGNAGAQPVEQSAPPGWSESPAWHSMFTRAVAGVDVAAASALPTQLKFFLEFNLSAPLGLRLASTRQDIGSKRIYLKALNAAMVEKFGNQTPKDLPEATVQRTNVLCAKEGQPSGIITPGVSREELEIAIDKLKGAEAKKRNARQQESCLGELESAMKEKFGVGEPKALSASTVSTVNKAADDAKATQGSISADVSKPQLQTLVDRGQKALYDAEDPTNHRFWVWLNPRISSLPKNAIAAASLVNSSSGTFNSLTNSSLNDVVQGFEVLGGLELMLNKPQNAVAFGNAHISASLFGGAGFSTPFSVSSSNAQEFNLPQTLTQNQFTSIFGSPGSTQSVCTASNPAGGSPTTYSCPTGSVVAYVPTDRSRFYPQYYAGVRLKTFYYQTGGKNAATEFGGLCADRQAGEVCPVFPGTFDLGVGQNAAVSGGNLHGWVLRAEAFYPLPFAPTFHLYFTSLIHLGGREFTSTSTPVILNPTSPFVDLASPNVALVPVAAPNRDFYRLGVGVDLAQLLSELKKKSQPQGGNNTGGGSNAGQTGKEQNQE
jgi:hypothetical protein